MSDSGEAKTPEELESQQREVDESSDKSRLDEDSEKVARTEDDDALPLACPICKTHFLDPIVTICDHYFCNLCALKHHEKDTNCFVCKNPTLGVFKPSVEIKYKIAKVLENAKPQLKSKSTEEESQSQHSEMAESSNKRKLDEDSEQVARAEDDDDALPLACPFCELPFLDPVVTTCDHYFCNLCALKHHKNDATCFVCKNHTLGVFKPSVEIKNKIAKVRENMKPQENKAAMFDFKEYTSQYIGSYYQGRPLLLRVLHMVTHKLLDEEDNLQALQFLFDRLKPGKYIYKTNPEFLQLVSDHIGGRKGDEYIATQKMLQGMRKEYNEIRDTAFSSPPFRKVEDMERSAHVLGRFLYANGHVREAYKELSKVQSTILFMVVALEAREFEVLSSLPAVESLRGVSCNEELTMQEECIRALAHLGKGDYYTAACKFQKVMKMYLLAELWKRCPFELLTLDDIHMFCTWTAMATMTRREIEKVASVMGKKRANHSYRYLLSQYIARNYSECVRFLHEQLKSKARKDMYLFDHVDRLCHLITERCITEAEKFRRDFDKLLALITEEED